MPSIVVLLNCCDFVTNFDVINIYLDVINKHCDVMNYFCGVIINYDAINLCCGVMFNCDVIDHIAMTINRDDNKKHCVVINHHCDLIRQPLRCHNQNILLLKAAIKS